MQDGGEAGARLGRYWNLAIEESCYQGPRGVLGGKTPPFGVSQASSEKADLGCGLFSARRGQSTFQVHFNQTDQ